MPLYVNYPTKCLANPVTFQADFKFPQDLDQLWVSVLKCRLILARSVVLFDFSGGLK